MYEIFGFPLDAAAYTFDFCLSREEPDYRRAFPKRIAEAMLKSCLKGPYVAPTPTA